MNHEKKKSSSSGFSQRYKCIDPKFMLVDILYSFSWNLEEQPVSIKNGKSYLHLRDYYNMVIRRLRRLKYCSIKLYPEISGNGKFHFHGTIKIIDIALFLLLDLPFLKDKASYEIDQITDSDKWKTYMWKCDTFMKPLCDENKLPYTWHSDAKEVKLDALTCLKDGMFSTMNTVCLDDKNLSDEESTGEIVVDV